MIKKADHWMKVNGEWYGPGQEYDDGKRDPAAQPKEPVKPEEKPEPKTRARRRK